jgi:hypothetical protein
MRVWERIVRRIAAGNRRHTMNRWKARVWLVLTALTLHPEVGMHVVALVA